MSVMDKLINAMKFNDDEDFDEDEEYEEEDYYGDDKPAAAAEPVRNSRAAQTSASFDDLTEDEEPAPAPRARKRFGGASADKSESSTVDHRFYIRILLCGSRKCHEDLSLYFRDHSRKRRCVGRHFHSSRYRPHREQFPEHALRRKELIPRKIIVI